MYDVVGVVGVSYSVGSAQQHLEGDVWDELSHGLKALPGVLVEEPQRNVERCAYARPKNKY